MTTPPGSTIDSHTGSPIFGYLSSDDSPSGSPLPTRQSLLIATEALALIPTGTETETSPASPPRTSRKLDATYRRQGKERPEPTLKKEKKESHEKKDTERKLHRHLTVPDFRHLHNQNHEDNDEELRPPSSPTQPRSIVSEGGKVRSPISRRKGSKPDQHVTISDESDKEISPGTSPHTELYLSEHSRGISWSDKLPHKHSKKTQKTTQITLVETPETQHAILATTPLSIISFSFRDIKKNSPAACFYDVLKIKGRIKGMKSNHVIKYQEFNKNGQTLEEMITAIFESIYTCGYVQETRKILVKDIEVEEDVERKKESIPNQVDILFSLADYNGGSMKRMQGLYDYIPPLPLLQQLNQPNGIVTAIQTLFPLLASYSEQNGTVAKEVNNHGKPKILFMPRKNDGKDITKVEIKILGEGDAQVKHRISYDLYAYIFQPFHGHFDHDKDHKGTQKTDFNLGTLNISYTILSSKKHEHFPLVATHITIDDFIIHDEDQFPEAFDPPKKRKEINELRELYNQAREMLETAYKNYNKHNKTYKLPDKSILRVKEIKQ